MTVQSLPTQESDLANTILGIMRGEITLAQARGLEDEDLEAIYGMGYSLYGHGKFEDATKVFRFLSMHHHLEKKYFLGLGASLQMQREYRRALQAYSQVALLDVEDPQAHYHAGECFLALAMQEEAVCALEAAEELDRDGEYGIRDRAKAHLALVAENLSTSQGGTADDE